MALVTGPDELSVSNQRSIRKGAGRPGLVPSDKRAKHKNQRKTQKRRAKRALRKF